ncbi:MAG: hypothetical protein HW416_836 [Chloroflexi bacterium]|nr:hypothetical protein [Chloroflexota bacterium]
MKQDAVIAFAVGIALHILATLAVALFNGGGPDLLALAALLFFFELGATAAAGLLITAAVSIGSRRWRWGWLLGGVASIIPGGMLYVGLTMAMDLFRF